MLEVGGGKGSVVIRNIKLAGKKLGSVKMRNQILLLLCQLELGQKNILNNIKTKCLNNTERQNICFILKFL